MTRSRYEITLTGTQDEWVKHRLAMGGYQTESDYFRELVTLDQRRSLITGTLRNDEPDNIPFEDESDGRSSVWESAADRYQGK